MKKWTTTPVSGSGPGLGFSSLGRTSLELILETRSRMNEVEIWAILGQSGQALQDLLLSINSEASNVTQLDLNLTPKMLLCSVGGKVAIQKDNSPLDRHVKATSETEQEAAGIRSLGNIAERCIEKSDVQISENLIHLIQGMKNNKITLLELMQRVTLTWSQLVGSSPISLIMGQLCKFTLACHQQNATNSSSSVHHLLTNHDIKSNRILNRCLSDAQQVLLPPPNNQINSNIHPPTSMDADEDDEKLVAPLAEVEFSRLDASSISSNSNHSDCSENVTSSMPDLAHNHNNNNHLTPKSSMLKGAPLSKRLKYHHNNSTTLGKNVVVCSQKQSKEESSSVVYENFPFLTSNLPKQKSQQQQHSAPLPCPSSSSVERVVTSSQQSFQTPSTIKRAKPVQRNPSRLYRVVKPLTEITPSISPATKRCVGPEFVVMSSSETGNKPIVIDMASNLSRKDQNSISKQVSVIMLNGQRILIRCNPHSVTSGEILDQVLSNQDIKESLYYALSVRSNQEYWVLSNETKLSKVAPSNWKESVSNSVQFELYLRFKFLPNHVDEFRDHHNKHQLYLQLRRDVVDARYHVSVNQHQALAGMALQTEFGDFSEDIHGDSEYFVLEHYVPNHVIKLLGERNCRRNLTKLHRSYLGHSQSKTELKYCKEIQRLDNYGFQNFVVRETKKMTNLPKRHLGIHLQGVFLFETSQDLSVAHKILASFYWQNITRIQYDKCRFQISIQNNGENNKFKFYVSEIQSKLMFDLSSAHHQFYLQQKLNSTSTQQSDNRLGVESNVEYREPRSEKTIRTLKNRLLSRKQLSQRKLYTSSAASGSSFSVRRSTSSKEMRNGKENGTNEDMLVKRLTHYSSMADALVDKGQDKRVNMAEDLKKNELKSLNTSDKENMAPNRQRQNYRYKVYLEPDEDGSSSRTTSTANSSSRRAPLQEKPILVSNNSPRPPAPPPRPHRSSSSNARKLISTLATTHRRRSDSAPRKMATSVATNPCKKTRRSIGGPLAPGTPSGGPRMGTRISISALHRERLRLNTDFSFKPPNVGTKKRNLDLDYGLMEFKSVLPLPATSVVAQKSSDYEESHESDDLSDSLIERFDNMESEESVPERQIVSVTITKENGKLGLKITGTPSGIYVDQIEKSRSSNIQGDLKVGDRLVAINGRSLENVPYSGALDLIRKSGDSVQFLVSQIKATS